MNTYTLPGYDGIEGISDDDEFFRGLPDASRPQQVQTQALEQQENSVHGGQSECLDKDSPFQLQSSINIHNHQSDPVQLEIQPEMPFQSTLQNMNPYHEQPMSQNDLQNEQKHMRDNIHMLQSQLNAKNPEPHLVQEDPRPDLQLPSEQQDQYADESIQDPQFEDLLMQVLNSQSPMEITEPIQTFPEFVNPPPAFQRFEGDNSENEGTKVDGSQQNMPPEHFKQHNSLRRKMPQSNDQNPPKRRNLGESITENSNKALEPCSAFKVGSSDALRTTKSDLQVKCILCEERFADWHEMRTHFRMNHASTCAKLRICQECLMTFSKPSNLRNHWERAHVGQLDFVCGLCGARFSKKRNLSVHWAMLHSDGSKET